MFGTVVDVVKHHILDGDAALVGVGFLQIATHRSEEGFDIVLFVDRYNFVTNFIVRRMQRNRQRDVNHITQLIQRRDNA